MNRRLLMWWLWALLCGLVLTWGFEIRVRDFSNRVVDLQDSINSLKDEIARLRNEIKGQMKYR